MGQEDTFLMQSLTSRPWCRSSRFLLLLRVLEEIVCELYDLQHSVPVGAASEAEELRSW